MPCGKLSVGQTLQCRNANVTAHRLDAWHATWHPIHVWLTYRGRSIKCQAFPSSVERRLIMKVSMVVSRSSYHLPRRSLVQMSPLTLPYALTLPCMMASINNPKVAEQLRYPSILGPTLKNKNMNKHNLTVENLLHSFRDGEAKASKAPAQIGQEWKCQIKARTITSTVPASHSPPMCCISTYPDRQPTAPPPASQLSTSAAPLPVSKVLEIHNNTRCVHARL